MRFEYSVMVVLALGFVALDGCSDNSPVGDPIGSPCSPDSLCDGLCLLDLPNGMCSRDCSLESCPEGFVCGDISDGRYCLAGCDSNEACSDGLVCIGSACQRTQPWGSPCDDDSACTEGVCYEGACNRACREPTECPEPLSCVDTGEGTRCVLHEWVTGEGTYGEPCALEVCASGFHCFSQLWDHSGDPDAICTGFCQSDLGCPPWMSCRLSQAGGSADAQKRCVPRDYCERCDFDAHCPADHVCVSDEPEAGDEKYCSPVCDPQRPTSTCPTDSTCREAMWCESDRTWVVDCAQCSASDSCGPDPTAPRYHCFQDYGACTGAGYCAPCYVDEQCPEGGTCTFETYTHNRFCTAPCGDSFECSGGSICVDSEEGSAQVCVPRTGSCSVPAGDGITCGGCVDYRDCASGYCMSEDLENPYGATVCWEDCPNGDVDCPPYSQCYALTDGASTFPLCGPAEGLTCRHVKVCQSDCPEGPDSCSSVAPEYCR